MWLLTRRMLVANDLARCFILAASLGWSRNCPGEPFSSSVKNKDIVSQPDLLMRSFIGVVINQTVQGGSSHHLH